MNSFSCFKFGNTRVVWAIVITCTLYRPAIVWVTFHDKIAIKTSSCFFPSRYFQHWSKDSFLINNGLLSTSNGLLLTNNDTYYQQVKANWWQVTAYYQQVTAYFWQITTYYQQVLANLWQLTAYYQGTAYFFFINIAYYRQVTAYFWQITTYYQQVKANLWQVSNWRLTFYK